MEFGAKPLSELGAKQKLNHGSDATMGYLCTTPLYIDYAKRRTCASSSFTRRTYASPSNVVASLLSVAGEER